MLRRKRRPGWPAFFLVGIPRLRDDLDSGFHSAAIRIFDDEFKIARNSDVFGLERNDDCLCADGGWLAVLRVEGHGAARLKSLAGDRQRLRRAIQLLRIE